MKHQDNPVSGGAVALAALAVAGVAWLVLRPREAAAATSPAAFTDELPSFVPSAVPAPQPVTGAPKLPPLNCVGKVKVTYKFKDSPLLLNVYRRLTTWNAGGTPDSPTGTISDRVWAPSTTSSFFDVGVQDEQGWVNSTPLENKLKDVQDLPLTPTRYLAEAWVETSDGWCLAATSTNYEPWV